MKVLVLIVALSLSLALSANAALIVTDGGTSIPTGFATGFVNTTAPDAAPLNDRFGWDAGEEVGQTFTLGTPITLDSIFIAYNGFDDPGDSVDFTITVDEGDNGSDEITETITLTSANFSGDSGADGNSGPTYWMEWDVSSNGLLLPAGVHSFNISLDSVTGNTSWSLAPQFQFLGNGYAGGVGTGAIGGNIANDLGFAVTGTAIPEPSSLMLVGLGAIGLVGCARRRR